MPDLTPADIIALCRAHPLTCGRLKIEIDEDFYEDGDTSDPFVQSVDFLYEPLDDGAKFRRWLTGALVELCDEMILHIDWTPFSSSNPTRLHAMFAACEAKLKEQA